MDRSSGILMHISSLPSNYGIGTLGHEAYRFVDFLKRSKLKYWQVLPINPTSYGDSPYAAFSAFAGNPYFIDLDILCGEKLIYENEYINKDFGENRLRVDYGKQFNTKIDILKIAYNRDKAERNLFNNIDYINFKTSEDSWLKDYALFMATKYFFNLKSWQTWPEDIKRRDCGAIAYYTNKLEDSIEFFKYVQFKFFEQWYRLKSYANRNGIKIIGDVPIYVAVDSADAWANSQLFELDENKNLIEVAGCPPDNFSADGQLWGNPVYNWDNNAKEDFRWWISRIKLASSVYDVIRLDHFRGFDSYYAVPFGSSNARHGIWREGPKMHLFNALRSALGNLNVIAEDLGQLTPSVYKLLNETTFPGMKILQFAFGSGNSNEYLPHNFSSDNYVIYTGTHDNDTMLGYFTSVSGKEKDFAMRYINASKEEDKVFASIRCAYASKAKLAIIPVQDFLELGNEARMNLPSSLSTLNWSFRIDKNALTDNLSNKIKELVETNYR